MFFCKKRGRKWALVLIAVLIFSLCACAPSTDEAHGSSDNSVPSSAQQGQAVDAAELASAMESGEPVLLWRIDENAQLTGTASSWRYTAMDCAELWTDIQAQVFSEAEVLSDEVGTEDIARRISISLSGSIVNVTIYPDRIYINSLDLTSAEEYAGKIAALLEEKSGIRMDLRAADTEEGELLRYAYYVEDIPVDTKEYATTLGSGIGVWEDAGISLTYPILLAERAETNDLSQCLSMSEVALLCDLQWKANGVPMAYTLDDYELMYFIDSANGQLVPAWRFKGRFYDSSGYTHATDFVLHGLTGEVIRFF